MLDMENRKKFSSNIDDLFDLEKLEDINSYENLCKTDYTNNNELNTIQTIVNSFKGFNKMKIGDKYNIKSAFSELLAYNIFLNKFPKNKIKRECYISSNSYKCQHTVDIAVYIDNNTFIASECKYSSNVIAEKDISNLINIKNNFKHSKTYI